MGVAGRVAGKMADLLRARGWGVSLEERKVSLVGITELRVWRWDQDHRNGMGEVRAQGLEEELPRRSVTHGGLHSRPASLITVSVQLTVSSISMKHIQIIFTG